VPTAPRGAALVALDAANRSLGRFPDGADTDSNCADFLLQPATTLAAASVAGATNIKVGSVAGLAAGQTIAVDSGPNSETAVIATVGAAGATTLSAGAEAGATVIPVAGAIGFTAGQTVTIDSGANRETAIIASVAGGRGGARVTVAAPLARAHAAGAQLSGSGITLAAPLSKAHAGGAQVASDLPTPGGPNKYSGKRQ
jgi:non-reducing end alpha-L-arabinofuranosidase